MCFISEMKPFVILLREGMIVSVSASLFGLLFLLLSSVVESLQTPPKQKFLQDVISCLAIKS